MSVRTDRIAYQIWWLIHETAGECTTQDMAEFTEASEATCAQICRKRGWTGRYRVRPPRRKQLMSPEGIALIDDALACPLRDAA